MSKKVVQFMDTSFRDGFQSVFGARVLTDDFLPAVKASVDAGITNIEAGGGARFQSLFFYLVQVPLPMPRIQQSYEPQVHLQNQARPLH